MAAAPEHAEPDPAELDRVPSDAVDHYQRLRHSRTMTPRGARQRSAARIHGLLTSAMRLGLVPDKIDEEDVGSTYDAGRNAIRKSMNLLVKEGIVTRTTKLGTQVIADVADLMDGKSGQNDAVLLERLDVPSSPVLRARLQTESPTVHLAEWLLIKHEVPIALVTNYWVDDVEARPIPLLKNDLAVSFQDAYGHELGHADITVRPALADENTARTLAIEDEDLLLLRERVLFDRAGVPRELSHGRYVGSRISLTFGVDY